MFIKGSLITIFVMFSFSTITALDKRKPPEGISHLYHSKVDIEFLNDAVIKFLNTSPYRKNKNFQVKLSDKLPIEDLTRIKEMPWIQNLKIGNLDGMVDLNLIKPLKQLAVLAIRFDKGKNYDAVAALPKLEKLTISEQPGSTDIAFVAKCKKLKDLSLRCVGNVVDYAPLKELTGLKALDVHENGVNAAKLAPISTLKNIEKLKIDGLKEKSLDLIKGMTKVRYLSCYGRYISDISALSNMPELEYLSIRNNPLTDLTPLSKCVKLKELDLESTKVTDLKPLSVCKKLEDLNLDETEITDLSPLAGCTNLRILNLSKTTKLTTLKGLSACKNLESVHLRSSAIKDIKALYGCEKLGTLNLASTKFSDWKSILKIGSLWRLDLPKTVNKGKIKEVKKVFKKKLPKCDVDF